MDCKFTVGEHGTCAMNQPGRLE